MILEGIDISWLGHDCFKIKFSKLIYFDPFQIKDNETADIIFISHEHFDHCSKDDLQKISNEHTIIVMIPDAQSKISGVKFGKLILVEPNKKYNVDGLEFETIPAYNINKYRSPGIHFHPKQDERVGFIINIKGKIIFHSGDTDFTPELKNLNNIDIALVPVSGTYVMTAEEAAEAVNAFKPKLAIPMHYGAIVGNKKDAERFKELSKVEVMILEKE